METKKIISPAALNALKEALTNIYWQKSDLRSFVLNTVNNKLFVMTIAWDTNTKYISASEIVDRMSSRLDIYQDDLFALFEVVINFNDFSHLRRWDDAEIKIKRATDSVNALRAHAKGYFEIKAEKQEIERRKQVTQQKMSSNVVMQSKLESLHQKFISIALSDTPQKRGYDLERLFNELFTLFDLDPKASFKIIGEQIDGAFTFDNDDYLLEAKWQQAQVRVADLYAFAGKVNAKLKNTLGLFFSMDGFSQECLQVTNNDVRSLILMDGSDLDAVLTGRISLKDLLYRKRRYASETGNIYLPIAKILMP